MDKTVACWGGDNVGQATPATGPFAQVSAGYDHACGLRTDGSVACWGANDFGQLNPPRGVSLAVSHR